MLKNFFILIRTPARFALFIAAALNLVSCSESHVVSSAAPIVTGSGEKSGGESPVDEDASDVVDANGGFVTSIAPSLPTS